MTMFLSDQIDDAMMAMDAIEQPSQAQLMPVLPALRSLLSCLKDFATEVEQAHRDQPHVVPMWATAAAGARLYKALARDDVPPGVPLPDDVVVSIDRYRGRRA